jgi:hypothetical protein
VPVAVHKKAQRAADAAGMSISAYIEALIVRDEVDATGCPAWRTPALKGQEELPLRTA